MAKATAICTCKKCGETFEKSVKKANRREADAWEVWAVKTFDICPKCWGEEQRAKEEATPLGLEVYVDPTVLDRPIAISFTGNTRPHKDNIRDIGFQWEEKGGKGFLGALATKSSGLGWVKHLSADSYQAELDKAKGIGVEDKNVDVQITEADLIFLRDMLSRREKERQKKQEQIEEQQKERLGKLEALGPAPVRPACIPQGMWNGKIYGKAGGRNVYVDNKRIVVSNDEAAVISKYLEDIKAYNAAKAAIK